MKAVSIVAIAIFALVALCSSVPIADQQQEAEARLDIYNDFLSGLFSGLVQTTFGSVSSFLNQLITENPLQVGKRDAEDDLASRIDALGFVYDNILSNLFSGLVNNAFNTASGALLNLIQTNPLGIGKRADGLNVNVFQFLYDNVISGLFGGLASNTANYLQNSLNNLLQKPFGGIGKRSVDVQQAQTLISQAVSSLVQKFKTFARQAVAAMHDKQKLNVLVQNNIAEIKSTVAQLAKQLSQIIPSTITTEVTQVLALLQSTLVYWTSGLGGSLGPVIGPFPFPPK